MAKQAGYIGKLAVSDDAGSTWYNVGGLVDAPENASINMLDASDHDGAGWEEVIPGLIRGDIPVTMHYNQQDAGQTKMKEAAFARTSLEARVRFKEGVGEDEYEGTVYVENWNPGQPVGGLQSLSCTLRRSGSFTPVAQT